MYHRRMSPHTAAAEMIGTKMKLLALAVVFCCVARPLAAQPAAKIRLTRIWYRSTGKVGAGFDGVVAHEPAFIGEDKVRARLQLLNKENVSIFANAFDLSSTENDRALLRDVF